MVSGSKTIEVIDTIADENDSLLHNGLTFVGHASIQQINIIVFN